MGRCRVNRHLSPAVREHDLRSIRPRCFRNGKLVIEPREPRGTREGVLATLDSDKSYSQRKYSPFTAYGDSKLANILFAKGLAKRGIHAYALHPGVINTNLSRSMGFSGIIFRAVGGLFMKSVAQGAATSVYAATAPELESQSGAYLSDCAVVEPAGPAKDDALVEQVWKLSEKAISASR